MGRSIRYLGAAALSALFVAAQTDTALAVPFDIDCDGQVRIDTASPMLLGCALSPTDIHMNLSVFLESDDRGDTPYHSNLEIILIGDSTASSVVLYSGSLVSGPAEYRNGTFDARRRLPPPPRGTWREPTSR